MRSRGRHDRLLFASAQDTLTMLWFSLGSGYSSSSSRTTCLRFVALDMLAAVELRECGLWLWLCAVCVLRLPRFMLGRGGLSWVDFHLAGWRGYSLWFRLKLGGAAEDGRNMDRAKWGGCARMGRGRAGAGEKVYPNRENGWHSAVLGVLLSSRTMGFQRCAAFRLR